MEAPYERVFTLHRVLDWRTRQEKTIAALEIKQRLPPHTARVLDVLSFIEDHILPSNLLKVLLILYDL